MTLLVAEVDVRDRAAYEAWAPRARRFVEENGGKFLAMGFDNAIPLMGPPPGNRVVIVEFPSEDHAQEWWNEGGEDAMKEAEQYATVRLYSVENKT